MQFLLVVGFVVALDCAKILLLAQPGQQKCMIPTAATAAATTSTTATTAPNDNDDDDYYY